VRRALAAVARPVADDDVSLAGCHRHGRQDQRSTNRAAAGGHAGKEAQVRDAHAVEQGELVDVLDVEAGDAVDVLDGEAGIVERRSDRLDRLPVLGDAAAGGVGRVADADDRGAIANAVRSPATHARTPG
jgi:hypothetical protein